MNKERPHFRAIMKPYFAIEKYFNLRMKLNLIILTASTIRVNWNQKYIFFSFMQLVMLWKCQIKKIIIFQASCQFSSLIEIYTIFSSSFLITDNQDLNTRIFQNFPTIFFNQWYFSFANHTSILDIFKLTGITLTSWFLISK